MVRKFLGMVFPALKPSSSRRDELRPCLPTAVPTAPASTRMRAHCCVTFSGFAT